MSKPGEINKQALWWTTIIVAITSTLIGKLFEVINRSANSEAYASAKGYFSSYQPDFFPLMYLVAAFFGTLIVVWIYSILLPRMPQNWILRGLTVGIILYVAVDMAHLVKIGYETGLPPAFARGMAFFSLLASLINGCILSYVHSWVSGERKKSKQ